MNDEDRKIMCETIEAVVRKTVNGKIDGIKQDIKDHNTKHEADMQEIKPLLQVFAGGRVIGNLLTWVSGVAVAYLMIKGLFTK